MIRADYKDKELIIDILTSSFADNKSVNYIIKQDGKRIKRLRNLMDYSFEICYMFGDVFLSDDRKGCALIVLPEKRKTSLKAIMLNLKLIIGCTGLSYAKKAMDREGKIKKHHPKQRIYYLWFLGVDSNNQNRGIGSSLMKDVIKQAELKNRPVYLETSTLKNIPWYEKFGFQIFKELDFGYKLYLMKKE